MRPFDKTGAFHQHCSLAAFKANFSPDRGLAALRRKVVKRIHLAVIVDYGLGSSCIDHCCVFFNTSGNGVAASDGLGSAARIRLMTDAYTGSSIALVHS